MKVIGLMPVRNEEWCLRLTLPAAAKWLDSVVVLDHASTDSTPNIISEARDRFPDAVFPITQHDQEWQERKIRQSLLDMGRCLGGTHFVLLDADEIVTPYLTGHIRATANSIPLGQARLLPLHHLWRSTDQYRCDNSPFGRAWVKFIFADASRVNYITEGKEDARDMHCRFPINCVGEKWLSLADQGGVLHLHHVVWERAVWKQVWYQMLEVLRYGRVVVNYTRTVNEDGLILRKIPGEWSRGLDFSLLDLDSDPWQKAKVHELLTAHGIRMFQDAGVNFFGLL